MVSITVLSTIALMMGILANNLSISLLELGVATVPLALYTCYHVKKNRNIVKLLVLLVSFFVFGWMSMNYSNTNSLENHYGKQVYIKGTVAEVNRSSKDLSIASYQLDASINVENKSVKEKVLVYTEIPRELRPGMTLYGTGVLVEPINSSNFGVFDYRNYLKNQGIKGIVYLDGIESLDDELSWKHTLQNNFTDYIDRTLENSMGETEKSLLKGMILGDSSYIKEDVLVIIRRLGIAHIVAVSGLHIGIILSSIGMFLSLIQVKKPMRLTISLLIGLLYASLIGFPTSVVRALMMITILNLGIVLHRRYSPINAFAITISTMLLIRPNWLFDVGFQLSVSAVLGVIIAGLIVEKYRIEGYKRGLLYITAIQIFVLPASVYYFNYVPTLSILVNFIAIPIFSYVLIGGIIALLIKCLSSGVAHLILFTCDKTIAAVLRAADVLSSVSLSGYTVKTPSIMEVIFYFFTIGIIVYFILNDEERLNRTRVYYCIFCMYICFIILYSLMPYILRDPLTISVLDVGQGNSATVQYKDRVFMIDAGGEVSRSSNRTDYIFPEYFVKKGVSHLDLIFISHYHLDHYSGIYLLHENLDIDGFVSGYYNESVLNELGETGFYQINKGDTLTYDDKLAIQILWPPKGYVSHNENDNSLVLMLTYQDFKMLFTGDIEYNVEKLILDELSQVGVLMVPHHGSRTSSHLSFVKKTSPQYAIFSYGRNNYGIPHQEVIDRYELIGSQVLTTEDYGEIIISVSSKGEITVNSFYNRTKQNKSIMINSIGFSLLIFFMLKFQERRNENE